jgi:general secretion pathway protein B
MSYILDALRRAQAERERGQVPGLETRAGVETTPPPPRRRPGLLWLGGGLALAVLGLVVGLTWRSGPPVVPAALQTASAPAPAPVAAAAPASVPAQAPPALVVVSATAAPPVAGASSSTVRAVLLAQLSPELRREWPVLKLGGAIWSDNASSRFVIVNGQVLREGDSVAPGVLLERIGPKAVFLRWRDWRVEVPI